MSDRGNADVTMRMQLHADDGRAIRAAVASPARAAVPDRANAALPELVRTSSLKRRDQALADSRVHEKQYCDELFPNADPIRLRRGLGAAAGWRGAYP